MALVNKETYGQLGKHILIANDSYMVTLPARVTNTGVVADSDGKKILRAGTPLAGNITKRDTAFIKATTTEGVSNATAVLMHDVDVTDGAENGTIILAGCVDLLKLDSATQALVTSDVVSALPRIIFVEGSAI
jgi:hypothetical protein